MAASNSTTTASTASTASTAAFTATATAAMAAIAAAAPQPNDQPFPASVEDEDDESTIHWDDEMSDDALRRHDVHVQYRNDDDDDDDDWSEELTSESDDGSEPWEDDFSDAATAPTFEGGGGFLRTTTITDSQRQEEFTKCFMGIFYETDDRSEGGDCSIARILRPQARRAWEGFRFPKRAYRETLRVQDEGYRDRALDYLIRRLREAPLNQRPTRLELGRTTAAFGTSAGTTLRRLVRLLQPAHILVEEAERPSDLQDLLALLRPAFEMDDKAADKHLVVHACPPLYGLIGQQLATMIFEPSRARLGSLVVSRTTMDLGFLWQLEIGLKNFQSCGGQLQKLGFSNCPVDIWDPQAYSLALLHVSALPQHLQELDFTGALCEETSLEQLMQVLQVQSYLGCLRLSGNASFLQSLSRLNQNLLWKSLVQHKCLAHIHLGDCGLDNDMLSEFLSMMKAASVGGTAMITPKHLYLELNAQLTPCCGKDNSSHGDDGSVNFNHDHYVSCDGHLTPWILIIPELESLASLVLPQAFTTFQPCMHVEQMYEALQQNSSLTAFHYAGQTSPPVEMALMLKRNLQLNQSKSLMHWRQCDEGQTHGGINLSIQEIGSLVLAKFGSITCGASAMYHFIQSNHHELLASKACS